MSDGGWFWAGALVLNAAWALLLPTASGRIVAAAGVAIALLILSWSWRSRANGRVPNLLQAAKAGIPNLGSALAIAVFALPAISLIFVPRLAFWRLDGRSWLIVGWILGAIVLEFTPTLGIPPDDSSAPPPVPMASGLFVFWTFVLWMTVIFDLGVADFIMRVNRTVGSYCRLDPLTYMISTWEKVPVSQHLFLGWRTAASFAERSPYENHVHPYMLSMYAWIAGVRAIAGVPLYVASNSTVILLMTIIAGSFVVLLIRAGLLKTCRGATGFLTLFVAMGFVVTTWRFWVDLDQFNTDNPYPLVASIFVLVYAHFIEPVKPRLCIVASMIVVALGPIYLPMLLLAVGCLFGRPGRTLRELIANNQMVLRLCVWSTIVAFTVMAVPRVLVAWKGYRPQASTFLFRSGLDGDMASFLNIFQAAWSACLKNCCGSPRPITQLLFPAFLPLAIFFWPVSRSADSIGFGGLGRLLLFLSTPYFVSLIFFGQSVSIHPYLYDHLLIVPVVIAGAAAMTTETVRSRLHGAGLLAFLLFAAALIMSNLIATAQGLRPS